MRIWKVEVGLPGSPVTLCGRSGLVMTAAGRFVTNTAPVRTTQYYKSDNAHLTTTIWEAPEVGYPGRATFGLDASSGMYAGFGGLAPHGSGGFAIYREDHWAFEGTNLGYGDVLGAQSRIFGYEVDGLRYRIEDGLPFPEPADQLPEDLEILGMGLARMREDIFAEDESFVCRRRRREIHCRNPAWKKR